MLREHGGAEALHARGGRLERQHERPLTLSLARSSSSAATGSVAEPLELGGEHLARPRRGSRRGCRRRGRSGRCRVEALEGEDRVGKATLLADAWNRREEDVPPSRLSSTRRREAAVVVAREPGPPRAEVVLLGVLARGSGARGARCRGRRRSRSAAPARRHERDRAPRPSATSGSCSTLPAAAMTIRRGVALAWKRSNCSRVAAPTTSARPSIGGPSGWSGKIASPSTSKTQSWGSSSYIAISSSTTSRSSARPASAGAETSARSRRRRARGARRARGRRAMSSPCRSPALSSAPIASKIWSISSAR